MKTKDRNRDEERKIYSDLHFGGEPPAHEEIKALAEATAEMIANPTNTIITVMPGKDGKPVFITR